MLEKHLPEKAAEWYGLASDTTAIEDRHLQAAEYANKAVRMYLKVQQYDKAVKWAETALASYVDGGESRSAGRQACVIVILHLARDEPIDAQKAYIQYKK